MSPEMQEWKKNQTAFTQTLLCLNNFTDFPIRFKPNLPCPGPTHPTDTSHSGPTWFTGLSHCAAFSQVRTHPHIALGGSPGGQLPSLLSLSIMDTTPPRPAAPPCSPTQLLPKHKHPYFPTPSRHLRDFVMMRTCRPILVCFPLGVPGVCFGQDLSSTKSCLIQGAQ